MQRRLHRGKWDSGCEPIDGWVAGHDAHSMRGRGQRMQRLGLKCLFPIHFFGQGLSSFLFLEGPYIIWLTMTIGSQKVSYGLCVGSGWAPDVHRCIIPISLDFVVCSSPDITTLQKKNIPDCIGQSVNMDVKSGTLFAH